MRSLDLAALVVPLGPDEFLESYWEQRSFHGCGNAARFSPIFDVGQVDAVIASAPDREDQPGVYCVRSRQGRTSEYPVRSAGSRHVSMSSVYRAFDEGFTIVVNHLASVHEAISELCGVLASELDHPVGCNLYMTPARTQGFQPHRDFQDTFFLQIEGAKSWSVWKPTELLPVRREPVHAIPPPERPPDECFELGPGDVLYLPRGWIHAGATTSEHSVHLTLGVRATTVVDLIVELVERVARDEPAMRHGLPLAPALGRTHAAVAGEVRSVVTRLVELPPHCWTDTLERLLAERAQHTAAPLSSHFVDTQRRAQITIETVVEHRRSLRPVVVCDRTVRLSFAGSYVDGPAEAEAAMRFVAETATFRVGEIPGLPDEARCDLVRELILQGMMQAVGRA